MPWTTLQVETAIDALQTALARGQKSVTVAFADRSSSITYNSVDEILRALGYFQSQSLTLSGRPRQFAAISSKGFESQGDVE